MGLTYEEKALLQTALIIAIEKVGKFANAEAKELTNKMKKLLYSAKV